MDAALLPTIAAGAAAGVALGAIGGGGSVMLIPLLVIGFDLDAHGATGTALAVVLATALLGTALHARSGTLRYREALLFGGPGMLASALAAPVNSRLPEAVILVVVAALMALVALRMWRSAPPVAARRPTAVVVAAGAAAGALTGVFGVGGGFLIVPALVLVLGLPMKQAVGTSLLVIAANASAALGGYWIRGDVDLPIALVLAVGAAAGVVFGSQVTRALGEQRLQQTFAVFLAIAAGYLLMQEVVSLV